ncbi:hypothetical protein PEC301877_04800 [Pectobacterium carotovorum subsp. carotovorum]|nr:hypothetical protein PEC301877_04800 [Pectobacterium carotovorum subsp. carotovorum]
MTPLVMAVFVTVLKPSFLPQKAGPLRLHETTRLNILGALNLSDIGSTVIHDDKTINDYNTARFFIEMRKHHSDYRQKSI